MCDAMTGEQQASKPAKEPNVYKGHGSFESHMTHSVACGVEESQPQKLDAEQDSTAIEDPSA